MSVYTNQGWCGEMLEQRLDGIIMEVYMANPLPKKKKKNFIWRACKDILPTKTKLKNRKIPMEVECDICGGVEIAGHVF